MTKSKLNLVFLLWSLTLSINFIREVNEWTPKERHVNGQRGHKYGWMYIETYIKLNAPDL